MHVKKQKIKVHPRKSVGNQSVCTHFLLLSPPISFSEKTALQACAFPTGMSVCEPTPLEFYGL